MTEFPARAGMARRVRGRAVAAKDGFAARYDRDGIKGVPDGAMSEVDPGSDPPGLRVLGRR